MFLLRVIVVFLVVKTCALSAGVEGYCIDARLDRYGANVFQWVPWIPQPIPGRGLGPLRGDVVCWQQDFVGFPEVLKVFEHALPRPGAPPGGIQGGAFKKPMNFQGFLKRLPPHANAVRGACHLLDAERCSTAQAH